MDFFVIAVWAVAGSRVCRQIDFRIQADLYEAPLQREQHSIA